MTRFVFRCAIVSGLSVVVFLFMQLFDGSHCLDCGAKYGFPLSYMQDGTYATHGHVLWMGFLGDFAIAGSVSAFALWVWPSKKVSK
jgi:prepilin signal peptidase PulO-like enzyme (type II secretory pathway)